MRFLVLFRAIHKHFVTAELRAVVSTIRKSTTDGSDLILTPAFHSLECSSEAERQRKTAGLVLYGEVFYYVDLESVAEAVQVAERCLLVKAIFIPGGHGRTYEECLENALSLVDHRPYSELLDDVVRPSFKCVVFAFGRKYSMVEQTARMEAFRDLFSKFPGRVKLKSPDYEIWIMEDAFPEEGHLCSTGHKERPRHILLGLKIAEGCASLGHKYTLKRRCYIGPTSMDAELAFIMNNMARVRRGSLVLDPFCGTGSILISARVFKAHTIGSDMNILSLRGKAGERRNVLSNFSQYNVCSPLGLVRSDILHTAFCSRPFVDAVVCDPPYGIKEGTRAFRRGIIQDPSLPYFPPTTRVRFVDFLQALLSFAAEVLVPGGRLVYWLPTTNEYTDADVPTDPGLRLISNCEQPLTSRMSRRLITMEKVSEEEREKSRVRMAGLPASTRTPAHFNLASKILRQPHRSENHLSAASAIK